MMSLATSSPSAWGLFFGTGQSFPNVFGVGYGLGAGYVQLYTPTSTPTSFSKSYPIPTSQINNYIPSVGPPYALGFIVAEITLLPKPFNGA
jgi:hypothetical protein